MRRLRLLPTLVVPPSLAEVRLVEPALVDIYYSVVFVVQLEQFLSVERADYKASRRVSVESYMLDHGETHVEVLLQNASDVGGTNVDSMLSSDCLYDLRSSPDAGLLLFSDGVDCELELALLVALLLSELVDVVRLLFNPADQLAYESGSNSKAYCCLCLAKKLHTHCLPDFFHDVCS